MSKSLITELFCVVDAQNWDALKDFFCPDVVYERPGYASIISFDQLFHFYKCERILKQGQHSLERIVVNGNEGACWGRFVGVSKDNAHVDELFEDAYLFENGKIKWRRTHFFRPAI